MRWLAERIAADLLPRRRVLLSAVPPPVLPPSVSAEPGPLSLARTPYLREPLDRLSPDDPAEIVVFQGATQIGKSSLAILAWAGWVQTAPAPCLWVMDLDTKAEELCKYRLEPIIEATPALASLIPAPKARIKGNTTQAKAYPGGFTRWSGAQAASGLTSMQARYAILDELDDHDRAGLGDTVRLALGRTTTYGRTRKVLAVSSPTVAGESPIEAWFRRGDRRLYHVPCPFCGEMQPLVWRDPESGRHRVIWPDGRPEEAGYLCRACDRLIPESAKTEMLAGGEWRPSAEPQDPSVASYWLPALYAPLGWLSWGQLAQEWSSATERVKANDTAELRVFANTRLAECWEDRGETVDPAGLALRAERYPDPLPAAIRVVTAGVDVQVDRLEATWVGWGPAWEAWVLDHRIIRGDPHAAETWNALDALRERRWALSDGRILGTTLTCVDAGNDSQVVIDYCRRRAGALAIRGVAGTQKPIWDPKIRRLGSTASNRYHSVGVDAAKDWLAATFRVSLPGPRYLHVPRALLDAHPDWAEQACSEKRVRVMRQGKPVWGWRPRPGTRQEALDCLVYALAAAHAILAGRPGLLDPAKAPPSDAPSEAPKPRVPPKATRPVARQSKAPSWLSGRGRSGL